MNITICNSDDAHLLILLENAQVDTNFLNRKKRSII